MTIHIRPVPPTELEWTAPMLTSLLYQAVNGGSPLGFLPPLSALEAHNYWLSLAPELQSGTRLLLVAFTRQGPAGSAQLVLSTTPNGRHRAEIQKLFVAAEVRGNGVGRALVAALHYAARRSHRSLIVARRTDMCRPFTRSAAPRMPPATAREPGGPVAIGRSWRTGRSPAARRARAGRRSRAPTP